MREYKFRAWDENKKYLIPWENLYIELEDGYGCINDYTNNDDSVRDFVLMQYTGFCDKNGKEIYEGDILKQEHCWGIRIEFDKGAFRARDLDKVRYNNKILDIPLHDFIIENWEVIGNIYENGDLI